MSTTLSSLESKVRYLIGDNSTSAIPGDIFTYENSNVFTLTESNVENVIAVLVNDEELESGSWSYNSTTNKVTISSSLSSGDVVEIRYTYYPNYSSDEIKKYIQAALVHISANNYKTFIVENETIYPEPDDREKNLIALITSILIEPNNKTIRLPDVSIAVPRDLPTDQKISRAIALFKKDTHGILDIL